MDALVHDQNIPDCNLNAVAFSLQKLIYCTSQIKDPQESGELCISLVQELVGSPLPEAHPAVGPAGRQEGSAGVRRQT